MKSIVLCAFHEGSEIQPPVVTEEHVLVFCNGNPLYNYSRENDYGRSTKLLLCCGYFMRDLTSTAVVTGEHVLFCTC
jgi:hypothetical protein